MISELTGTVCIHGLKPQKKWFYTALSNELILPLSSIPTQGLKAGAKTCLGFKSVTASKSVRKNDYLRGQLVSSLMQCS